MNPVADMTLVVNLDRRPDRWLGFQSRAAEHPELRDAERLPAVDGKTCAERPPRQWRSHLGGWGAMLSYVRAFRLAEERGARTLLVLEDDCTFQPDWASVTREAMMLLPDDWTALYLGGRDVQRPTEVVDGLYRLSMRLFTHAVVYRVEHLLRLGEAIRLGITLPDRVMAGLQYRGVFAMYATRPKVCGQIDDWSDNVDRAVRYRNIG